MARFCFRETANALDAVSKLFDFIWPTTIGLWNLRWQVKGFLDTVPNATHEQAHARFVLGSGIHGADVKAMLKNASWESQQEKIAEIILTNAFAIYEAWAKEVFDHCPQAGMSDKDLAFPTRAQAYIAQVISANSAFMAQAFQPTLMKHPKYLPALFNHMLLCYRYFKEIRNVQMHGGGIADLRAFDAYNAFAPVAPHSVLGTKETIDYVPVVLGKPVKLRIRGVTGFSDILMRLMVTIDAMLASSASAEAVTLERLRAAKGRQITLTRDPHKITKRVKGYCENARVPIPADVEAVRAYLVAHRLVSP